MDTEQTKHARNAWYRTRVRLGRISERRERDERAEFVSSYARAFGAKINDVKRAIKGETPPKIVERPPGRKPEGSA